jgi:hypothetical protein
MLAGLLLGIVHDRRLMREAPVNLAIRWFIGYGLHEAPPDHSSLTRIRQRWGAERFRAVPARTAQSCVAAGIATGAVVHSDATLVRADVSWDAIARRHAGAVAAANGDEGQGQAVSGEAPPARRRPARGAWPGTRRRLHHRPGRDPGQEPPGPPRRARRQAAHGRGRPGRGGAGRRGHHGGGARTRRPRSRRSSTPSRPTVTGRPVRLATMDAADAITRVFAALEGRAVEAVVPTQAERPPRGVVPVRRFKLDARNRIVRGPRKRILRPHGKPDRKGFQAYRASVTDCRPCPLRAACIGSKVPRRAILLHKDHPALLRARRKHARWGERERSIYARHRLRAEGCHGEAKTWHGLARAVRRGFANVRIQAYLTAAVINPKRLAAALVPLLLAVLLATRPMLARQRT